MTKSRCAAGLPIGGVKEGVRRRRQEHILQRTTKDLADIPKNVLDTLNVYMVRRWTSAEDRADRTLAAGRLPPRKPSRWTSRRHITRGAGQIRGWGLS